MIFDKCKNCKHEVPIIYYKKSIFSKKPKVKSKESRCEYWFGTRSNRSWCEKYERKEELECTE